MPLARKLLRGFALLVILTVFGLLALFASLWLEHRIAVTLPLPSGAFAVGRTSYLWSDTASKRELVVWIWYPAAADRSTTSEYLPEEWRTAIERDRGVLIGKFLTRDLARVRSHSTPNAAVSPRQPSYPVVMFRAGASLEVTNYSTLAEDLASHGYVVVAFDAPYRTAVVVFPDGRVVTRTPENNPESCLGRPDQESCASRLLAAWTADMRFVLDRLAQQNASDASGQWTGRLDLTRIGVFGHSFGGAAAALFCHEDSRCKACIDVDGAPHGRVIQTGINRPFLFLLTDHHRETGPESRQILADIQSIYDRLPAQTRMRILIRGANHFLFSDDGALLKSHIVLGTLRLLHILGIEGRRQLAVTAYCVDSFFDAYLKGESISRVKIASPLYPEIEVLE